MASVSREQCYETQRQDINLTEKISFPRIIDLGYHNPQWQQAVATALILGLGPLIVDLSEDTLCSIKDASWSSNSFDCGKRALVPEGKTMI